MRNKRWLHHRFVENPYVYIPALLKRHVLQWHKAPKYKIQLAGPWSNQSQAK